MAVADAAEEDVEGIATGDIASSSNSSDVSRATSVGPSASEAGSQSDGAMVVANAEPQMSTQPALKRQKVLTQSSVLKYTGAPWKEEEQQKAEMQPVSGQ